MTHAKRNSSIAGFVIVGLLLLWAVSQRPETVTITNPDPKGRETQPELRLPVPSEIPDSPEDVPVNGFFGYSAHPDESEAWRKANGIKSLREESPALFGEGWGDSPIVLTKALEAAVRETQGKQWVVGRQGIGDCVGWGWAHGCSIELAVQFVTRGTSGDFAEVASEATYGVGRVEGRGSDGSGSRPVGGWGDGSWGAPTGKGVTQFGLLFRKPYPELGFDLTNYSSKTAKQWGAYGMGGQGDGGKAEREASKHRVGKIALIRTLPELQAALRNGYPAPVCSGQGFSSSRDADGFARAAGSWAHCCLPGMIISTTVPKPCEEVMVGDEVLTHAGQVKSVEELHRRDYAGNVLDIRAVGPGLVSVTPEHPILIYRPMCDERWAKPGFDPAVDDRGDYRTKAELKASYDALMPLWVPASDVQVGDYMLSPRRIIRAEPQPIVWPKRARAAKTLKAIEPSDELAFLIGYYVANGNVRRDHGITITMPAGCRHRARLSAAICVCLGVEPRFQEAETFDRILVDSVILADAFAQWCGAYSHEKHFPPFIWQEDWNFSALLEGYAAGDGCQVTDNQRRVDTVSPALAYQAWSMLVDLGKHPTMGFKPKESRGHGSYANARDAYCIEWSVEHKRSNCRYWSDYYCCPVRSIESRYWEGQVYNYEVADDHSYLASGVAVHNCMAWVGYRSDPEGYLCLNSWGPNWISGPKVHGQPDGSFWVHPATASRMLNAGDTYAVSGTNGFPPRKIDWRKGW